MAAFGAQLGEWLVDMARQNGHFAFSIRTFLDEGIWRLGLDIYCDAIIGQVDFQHIFWHWASLIAVQLTMAVGGHSFVHAGTVDAILAT
jgi:hypothetical protein